MAYACVCHFFFVPLCPIFVRLYEYARLRVQKFEVRRAVRRETKTSKIYVYEIQCIEF